MTAMSGQVKGAGSYVVGTQHIQGPLVIKALLGNAGNIAVADFRPGQAGQSHIELDAGDTFYFDYVGSLYNIVIVSQNAGDGVCWIMLDV